MSKDNRKSPEEESKEDLDTALNNRELPLRITNARPTPQPPQPRSGDEQEEEE